MVQRTLQLATTCLLIVSICAAPLAATTQRSNGQQLAQRIKTRVQKIGTGNKVRVEVRLEHGTKIKGYISEVRENEFVVTDKKGGFSNTIEYTQVNELKTPDENAHKDPAVWLGIALGVGVIAFSFWAKDRD